ncbi:tetratricopeptide repeat protein [Pelagibacterium lacus]|uniref:Ancillary SecYEG translocon subunit/Cell division coordinator CpoB TPR domain-containing protein n=1 Tax=Pelagibacterium lacus TaxID=2282655 RepID=A0A369W5L1_9HYPH|nr:tetratricopeptide repeat protein [Pelagibacterium lacus]RDE09848.1 hypothetical protein DVH29_04755 [Pelagibacterium lacus]
MSEDSFLREIEEELRSDKLKAFWRRFAPFIIGGAVLIVLLVAANEVWKWWRSSTAAEASDRYYAAVQMLDGGDVDGALSAFADLENNGPQGYAILSRFQQAAALKEQGQFEQAIAAYDALAASLDQPRLRELAYVMSAYIAVDHFDAAAVEARVGSMTGEENALRNNAREALGLAYYKAGNIENARARFEEIAADPMAAQDMQLRAYVYLEQLASTGVAVSNDIVEEVAPQDDAESFEIDLDALGTPMSPVVE